MSGVASGRRSVWLNETLVAVDDVKLLDHVDVRLRIGTAPLLPGLLARRCHVLCDDEHDLVVLAYAPGSRVTPEIDRVEAGLWTSSGAELEQLRGEQRPALE